MTDGEIADIKSSTEKLSTSSQNVFAKVYEQAQAGADPNASGEAYDSTAEDSDQNNDDVVDGDYKEI